MIPIYTKEDEEKYYKVLRDIQSRVPKALIRANLADKKKTPQVEFVLRKALTEPTISEEKKQQIIHLLDTGMFSQVTQKENPRISKQIDAFVMREIKKAVKAGLLPPFSHIKYFPSMQKIQNEN